MRIAVALLAVVVCACVSGLPTLEKRGLWHEPDVHAGDESQSKILYEMGEDGGYYFFNEVVGNWSEAFTYCLAEGGHMAVIESQADLDAIKLLMTNHTVTSIHLGFHDSYVEGVYMDVTDEQLEIQVALWENGAPTGGVDKNCGGLTAAGMKDIDCAAKQTSFCELLKWEKYDTVAGHGLYNFHPERRTWTHAWQTCHGEGGHLVVINSPEELDALHAMYPSWADIWVGVHRLNGNTVFTTVHSKPLEATGYMQWLPFYPYGDTVSRPYVAVKHSDDGVGLWTFTPTGQLPFICEHAAV